MAIRRLDQSWQYDFTLEGHGRRRKAGFRTKVEAREAEQGAREDLIAGHKRVRFADAYEQYMSATTMKDRSRKMDNAIRSRMPKLGLTRERECDGALFDQCPPPPPTETRPCFSL